MLKPRQRPFVPMRPVELILFFLLTLSVLCPSWAALAVEDWGVHRVFYLYAPTTAAPINIDIIGVQDGTSVWLLNITSGQSQVLASGRVDRMKILTFREVRHEGFYKLAADKPVVVLAGSDVGGIAGSTFYPATTRRFLGREFLFKTLGTPVVNFFAVEDADVTVYDEGGAVLKELKLPVAGAGNVTLATGKLYRATSTGDITVSSWVGNGFAACPSFTGSFVDKTFYARPFENGTLLVFAYADAFVAVSDRGRGSSYSLSLKRGEYSYQESLGATDLVIESSGDLAVWSGSKEGELGVRSVGDDVTYAGGRDAREFWFEALHRARGGGAAAVIFAWRDTEVKVNGTSHSLKADGYLTLPEGFYHLESDGSVIVEILGEDNFFNDWATALMSPSDATVDTTGLPSPQGEQGNQLVQYGGIAAVIVVALVLLLVRRRRPRTGTR